MKKFSLFLLGFIFLLTGLMFGEVAASLEDLSRPMYIGVDDTQFYVSEGTSVYIYSLKDYNLVKKFGKAGEGPSELSQFCAAFPVNNKILVNTRGKVLYFSRKGDFISEAKTKAGFSFIFMPIKDDYVGLGFIVNRKENTAHRTINIYDKDLNKKKTLFKKKMNTRRDKINPFDSNNRLPFQVWKDSIIVLDDNDNVNICDYNGKIINTIKPDYKKNALLKKDIEGMKDFYKTNPRTKQFYNRIKDRLFFPKNFPNLRSFYVADDKIYIVTYKKEGDKSEFIIYDKKGSLLKRGMYFCKLSNPKDPYPLSIKNNKIYQLVENEDSEEWELHVNNIK